MYSGLQTLSRRMFIGSLGTAAFLLLAGPGFAEDATPEDAQAMIASAIARFDEVGPAALEEISSGEASGFRKGALYVVVQSTGADAKIVAHAGNPALVGTALTEIADSQGNLFAVEISDKATADGSWFDYDWLNPSSSKVEAKTSWAVRHDDLVFVAGIYRK
jgi:hypothetical protein